MAKLKMNRLGIITLQSDGKALIEELQRLGIAELKATDDSRLSEMSVKESVAVYEKNIQTVSEALGILDKYAPSGKG